LDVWTLILFAVGLVLLILGAEALVRGASRLAAIMGISPLVIGLTIVAYGTGSPELAVVVQSALSGQSDIGLGNVVGSNISNVLLILGLSALISPLIVSRRVVRLEVLLMIGVSLLLLLLALNGTIGLPEGILLCAGALAYSGLTLIRSRKRSGEEDEQRERPAGNQDGESGGGRRGALLQILLILVGLVLLVVGSRWLVGGAVAIAEALGLSELIIGLTIVAIGTSLPELATSLAAAARGERDIAVGNIIGSNVFNILVVLGIAGIIVPGGVNVPSGALTFDIPVMIAAAIACLPIFYTGHLIARWEGALFFGYYIVYVLYLVLEAAEHDALDDFRFAMVTFVLPLTAVTLLTLAARSFRARRRRRAG
jgi:cation:H+ antiporter